MNLSELIPLRRIINAIHPRSPKSIVNSIEDMLDQSKNLGLKHLDFNCQTVSPSTSFTLDLSQVRPLTHEDYILDCDLKNHIRTDFSNRELFQLPNCRVLSSEGDVISEEGQLLAFLTPHNRKGGYHSGLLKTRYTKPKVIAGKSLNLIKPYATNYYHWTYEALPILRHVAHLDLPIDNYLVARRSPFVVSSLAKFGIHPDSIIEVSDQELLCETLYTTTTQTSMIPNPMDVNWISGQLSQKAKKDQRRIYLSREDAGWRGIENENQVINLLKGFGFESLTLSKMSVEDQIETFSSASCVISAHGAGLTNLAFCKQGVKVLEIFPPRWTPLCYAAVAQYIGADYFYCNADSLGLSIDQLQANKSHIPQDSAQQGAKLTIPLEKLELFCSEL